MKYSYVRLICEYLGQPKLGIGNKPLIKYEGLVTIRYVFPSLFPLRQKIS